jgi:DNA-binding ferritin-like protein
MDKDYLSLHLNEILACLRAQYLSYQTSHWQAIGPNAYQDHLLFERLYKSVEDQIDTLAEKLSGLTTSDEVSLAIQGPKIQHYLSQWGKIKNHHERGLHSEKIFQHLLRDAVECLEQTGQLTLGLDDFIAATASEHETNMYLLQQSLRPVRKNPHGGAMNIQDLYSKCYDLVDEQKSLDELNWVDTEDLARLWQHAETKRLESEEEMFATGNDDYYLEAQISERIQDEVEEVLGNRGIDVGEKGSLLGSIFGTLIPKHNPRKNPQTSALGSIAIAGIAGFLLSKSK